MSEWFEAIAGDGYLQHDISAYHRKIICLFKCASWRGGGSVVFLRHIADVVGELQPNHFADQRPQWIASHLWHDIAAHVFGTSEVFSRCVNFFGSSALNEIAEPKRNLTPLAVAIEAQNTEFVRHFVGLASAHHALVNFSMTFGGSNTYLHLAAMAGNREVVRWVLERFKADEELRLTVDAANDEDKSAFEICLERQYYEAANMFRTRPVDDGGIRNILLVGISQSGKSTFIKYLHDYNDQTSTRVEMGDGMHACTKECQSYRLNLKSKEFYAVAGSRKAGVFDLFKAPNLEIHNVEFVNKPAVSLRLIDTAGIGDDKDHGNGVDEQNIVNIFEFLKDEKISQLDGIIFIVKPSLLTSDLKARIKYYFDMFNRDVGNIYVVFTHYSKTDRLRDAKNKRDINQLRLDLLRDCGIKSRPYIFNMDLKPPSLLEEGIDDRDEIIEYLNNIEMSKLFRSIVSFGRHVEVNSIKFHKTANMKAAEERVLRYIEGRRSGAVAGISQFNTAAAQYMEDFDKMKQQVLEAENAKRACEDEIRSKDSDQLVDIHSQSYDDDWHWFYSRPAIPGEFVSDYDIHTIDRTKASTVKVTILEQNPRRCKVEDRDALVRIFTLSKHKYKVDVEKAKERLVHQNSTVQERKRALETFRSQWMSTSEQVRQLEAMLERYKKAALFLASPEITIAQYQKLRQIYHSTTEDVGERAIDEICRLLEDRPGEAGGRSGAVEE
ncbi:hypothetical protein DFJ73DRAFT_922383 [Zopfochytrium polystomum]|nr:hypothetical protein DFJ73DRAFT_922383 [Zopfochytrium polystomum]